MRIERRQRGANHGSTVSHTDKKVKFNLDINVLSLFCSFVLSENKNIRRGHLVNLRNLMAVMDMEVYQADPERKKLIEFINRGLEARIKKDIKDKRLILTYIKGGIIDIDFDELEEFSELSDAELAFVNDTVHGALDSMIIENNLEATLEALTRYKAEDYRYRGELIEEVKGHISAIHNNMRQVANRSTSETIFSFTPNELEQSVSDIYDKMTSPNRFLQSKMTGLNMMLGGGLEATRFYLLLGSAGVGKSLMMLNIAMQIKDIMKGKIKAKDPTKIPTILFLTQENSLEETVDRMFKIIKGDSMVNYTKEEVLEIFKQEGEVGLYDDTNNINIVIMYKPDRSIDTSDLYTIIEDLEDDGYEVIALFQDHIKRIRSAEPTSDVRLELGRVVNEMKTVGIIKDIVVMSVSHLNRKADEIMDENVSGNKHDLTRLLGRSNVGESLLMLDNSDAVFIIGQEYDDEGNKWIGINLLKLRYAEIILKYICYPYDKNNGVKICTDTDLMEPIYRTTMKPDNGMMNNMVNGSLMKSSSYAMINPTANEDVNIFDALTQDSAGETYSSSIEDMANSIMNMGIKVEVSKPEPVMLISRI